LEFDNSFEVPLGLDETWALLTDIERIAPCVPGAELTEVVDENTYKGKIAVRLGPVSLTFAGEARFESRDDAAHSARLKAQGTDARGRGGAHSDVTFHLEPSETGSRVLIHTDLRLSGSVAQYGRGAGMVSDLSQKLIDQFAENLAASVLAPEATAAAGAATDSTPAPAQAVQMGGIGLSVLWNAILRAIRRLFGGG
jgi:carbon monoxide dehydrogenase subunit G